jgi:NAD(P)-dependent dehydrogenase (short-subunit alcohol dehydrogenase family)
MSQTAAGIALVTGASRRIGAAIARDLASQGWRIAIHYRHSQQEAEALAAEMRALGSNAVTLAADLAILEEAVSVVPRCCELLGPPTCLINNASEFRCDSVASLTSESWSTHMDVNLRAPVFLARDLAAKLPEVAQGNVINIIDQRVWRPTPEFFSYTLSKAALWPATRMLAQALAPRVRVNAIGPGPVLQSVHQQPTDFEAEWQGTLLKRPTSVEEIAAAVRYILDAPAMTGQMIALDGGQHLV